MRYYPVLLDIAEKHCLVVGGGAVGARKVRTLLECGAHVTVVSTDFDPQLAALASQRNLTLKKRLYRTQDLEGMFMVIGATDDEALNRRISQDADRCHMLCNIADRPRACNFILPAIVTQGDLTIAVSTSGKSPAFAKHLRRRLEGEFGPEYAEFLRLMGAIRQQLLAQQHAPEAHRHLFEKLIAGGLLEMIRAGAHSQIDALLVKILGEGFSLAGLGTSSPAQVAENG